MGFANLPANREIIYTPGGTVDIPLYFISTGSIKASVSSPNVGDPSTLGTPEDNNILEYVTLSDPNPGGHNREAMLHFSFPQQFKPGVYFVDVHVADIPPEGYEATVSAVASAKLRLTVHVLTNEKVIEIGKPYAPATVDGVDANATITVTSRSLSNIQDMYAMVRVYDDGVLVAQQETPHTSLQSLGAVHLFTTLPTAALAGGEYDVNATVHFDGLSQETQTSILKIGTLHVDVRDVTDIFIYNTTNKFEFTIANQWNRELQDVFAVVTFGTQEKKTASLDIPPFHGTPFELYFDRDPTQEGTVPVTIAVTYNDYDPATGEYVNKEETFTIPVTIVLPAQEETPRQLKSTLLAVFMGVIVVLLLIIILLFLKGRKPEHNEPAHQETLSHYE
ncbi:MAG: hypothetical protein OXR66_01005 [Candidatus Woesearchaeota archaeon]|nr:hypothetical protein [Candidatus Woesearchaeota archaeon]